MRVTIKSKLGLAFASVIILAGITAWLGISNLASLNETMQGLIAGPVERLQMVEELSNAALLGVRAEKNLLLAAGDAQERAQFESELLRQREMFSSQLEKLDALATPEGKKRLGALRVTRQQWLEANDRIRALVRNNQPAEAISLSIGAGRQLVTEQERELADYLEFQQQFLTQAKDSATHQYDSIRLLLMIVTAAALITGSGTAFWIATSIARGLTNAGSLAMAVAGGGSDADRGKRIERRDRRPDWSRQQDGGKIAVGGG